VVEVDPRLPAMYEDAKRGLWALMAHGRRSSNG